MKEVTDIMETAASTADLSTARQNLADSMEKLREGLTASAPLDHSPGTGKTENKKTQNICNRYFIILRSFSTIIFVYVNTVSVYVFICMYTWVNMCDSN